MLSPLEISVCNSPSGDRAYSTATPCLWVEHQEPFSHLNKHFHVITPGEPAPDVEHHIIALPDERSIRQVLRKLPPEADIKIFSNELDFPTMAGLVSGPIAEDWLRLIDKQPLKRDEAIGIAEDLYKTESDELRLNQELDKLCYRVSLTQEMSSYSWEKKFMKPLRAKLEKDFKLPAFGGGSGGGDGGDGEDKRGKVIK